MASEIENLRLSIDSLRYAIQGQHGSSASGSGAAGTVDQHKKTAEGFDALNSKMRTFATAIISVGTVLKGLSGTREGVQLQYEFDKLAYEVANLVRGPLRWFTSELAGASRVLNVIGHSGADGRGTLGHAWDLAKDMGTHALNLARLVTGQVGPKELGHQLHDDAEQWRQFLGIHDASGKPPTARDLTGQQLGPHQAVMPSDEVRNRLRKEAGMGPLGRGADDLAPIFHTAFGSVTDLQNKMQSLSTENPALANQERGLTLIEKIYNVLCDIAGEPDSKIAEPSGVDRPLGAT